MASVVVPEIETERLLLRELTPADLPNLATRIYADPKVIRHLPKRDLAPRARAERTLTAYTELWEHHPVGGFAITAKVDGQFMGTCDLEPLAETNDWELGYRLGKAYWGQGSTTEAVRALLRFAFDTGAAERIVAAISRENAASRRVLEHVGFVYEKDVNYYEMSGDTTIDPTIQTASPIVPYFALERDQFVPGDHFYAICYRVKDVDA
jgi:[ribosomal protein S5]-alanine N-acetyltransferase